MLEPRFEPWLISSLVPSASTFANDIDHVFNVFVTQHRIHREGKNLFISRFCVGTEPGIGCKTFPVVRLEVNGNIMDIHPDSAFPKHCEQGSPVHT